MTPDLLDPLNAAVVPVLATIAVVLGGLAAQSSAPVACRWPARPDELMTRLMEVRRARPPGRVRSILGAVLLAGILASGSAAAYAAQPSAPERLPADVIGVVGSGDQLGLKVTIDQTVKTLNPGEEYRDGWTLKAITTSTATLTKGGESRVVGLNPAGALDQKSEGEASQVTVTGDLQAAIAAGDVGRIMQLKGSPTDIFNAERAILAKDPNAIVRPAGAVVINGISYGYPDVPLSRWLTSMDEALAGGQTPIFIHDDAGRNQIALQSADGRMVGITSVPGMNLPGAEPVGIAYSIPVPSPPPSPPPPPPPPPQSRIGG